MPREPAAAAGSYGSEPVRRHPPCSLPLDHDRRRLTCVYLPGGDTSRRRTTMRMKTRTKKAARSHRPANLKKLLRFAGAFSTRTKVVALICVVSTAALIGAARSRSHQETLFAQAVATPSDTAVAAPRMEPVAAVAEPVPTERPQQVSAVTITGCLER